jgi:prepilin-type N-terminal cleavage/methylation domain-containing protein
MLRPRHPAHRNAGFTLIEIMVVLVIMGVMATGISIGLDSLRGRDADQALKRLRLVLEATADRAIVRGRPIAIEFLPDGYRFSALDPDDNWRPLNDPPVFTERTLPGGLSWAGLRLDGQQALREQGPAPPRAPAPPAGPSGSADGAFKSRFRGVSFDKKKRKWRVQIKVACLGKSGVSVGYYETEEAAARAYDRAAIGLLGRDSAHCTTNFPLAEYADAPVPHLVGRSREEVKATLKSERARAPRRRFCSRARTSRFMGVGSSNRRNQWQARILVHGKVTHLGYYEAEGEGSGGSWKGFFSSSFFSGRGKREQRREGHKKIHLFSPPPLFRKTFSLSLEQRTLRGSTTASRSPSTGPTRRQTSRQRPTRPRPSRTRPRRRPSRRRRPPRRPRPRTAAGPAASSTRPATPASPRRPLSRTTTSAATAAATKSPRTCSRFRGASSPASTARPCSARSASSRWTSRRASAASRGKRAAGRPR